MHKVDRELLASKGRTLTGDRAMAMDNSHILLAEYEMIKGDEQSPDDWGKHIRSVSKKVVLTGDPGSRRLEASARVGIYSFWRCGYAAATHLEGCRGSG